MFLLPTPLELYTFETESILGFETFDTGYGFLGNLNIFEEFIFMNQTCKMGILNFFLVGYVFIVFFFSVSKVSILVEKVSRLDTGKLVETLETSRPRVSRLTALTASITKSALTS
jgi:hypothetical protein